ncbi:hypothetical protein UT300003_21170 [Clostridium sardiniense]|uniref:hypothetical protein n=1 Tax=Clostridium sardiniense TaxID=29369 RepID=UPI001958FDA9|nr:hypothetical protein [Clostridium sardiniense]MBM7834979.1 N-acetylmuramoyl-L-alanine amidase [Clostridium sardiniense]
MKIGIDINNSDISRAVRNQLKSKGYYVVDMSLEEKKSIGEEVFRKTILANTSNLDFLISAQINEGNNIVDVYYEDTELSKKFSEEFIKCIDKLGVSNAKFNNGEEFYLIKNTKASTSIIKMNLQNIDMQKENIVQNIISCIEYIRFIERK